MKALDDYNHARIGSCVSAITDYLKNNDLLCYQIASEDTWYRMRIQEKYQRAFPAKEMFHIPFQLRGKVNTQRFSLPGYPCLYISKSIWAAWEELHEPAISTFCVSKLKTIDSIEVLDLRVPDTKNIQNGDIKKLLLTIPWVIVCSIRIVSPDDNFKPEYIIPQMVMLSLVDDYRYQGCAYTSTQRNNVFKWPNQRLLDNVALPVQCIANDTGLCSKLCAKFRITDATNYDYELLKKPFESTFFQYSNTDECLNISNGGRYEESIFGQMESRSNSMELKTLTSN